MDSNAEQTYKRENRYLNINRVSVVLKLIMVLSKEVWNFDVTTIFPSLNAINGKTVPYGSKDVIRHNKYS